MEAVRPKKLIFERIKANHLGCLCCGYNKEQLSPTTELFFDFGGYTIYKDGQIFYQDGLFQPSNGKAETLREIDKAASLFPKSDWLAKLDLPLRGATYQRSEKGVWYLISENKGFA